MSAIDPENASDDAIVRRARERLAASSSGDDVLRAEAPGPFDLIDMKALVALALALVAVALVDLHPEAVQRSFADPLELGLRMVALTCVVRACVLLADGVRRLRARWRTRDHALVFLDDALVVFADETRVFPRRTIVTAGGGTRRDGIPILAILARDAVRSPMTRLVFGASIPASAVARRVVRYVRETEPPAPDHSPEVESPSRDPKATFEQALRGERAGVSVVGVSYEWLRRIPFAAPAFVLVFFGSLVLDLVVAPAADGSADWGAITFEPTTLALLAVCALLPIGYLAIGFAKVRAMGGAALVATPAELLLRTRSGMHRAPWNDILVLDLESRRAFTMLGGSSLERALVLERASGAPIRLDESLHEGPIEVVVAMLEAYSDGVGLSPQAYSDGASRAASAGSDSDSQGSGGGGGISSTEGTTT